MITRVGDYKARAHLRREQEREVERKIEAWRSAHTRLDRIVKTLTWAAAFSFLATLAWALGLWK